MRPYLDEARLDPDCPDAIHRRCRRALVRGLRKDRAGDCPGATAPDLVGEAFLWGLVGGSSLVLGGVIALRAPITGRQGGLIMAFGAGVLISAVAYELVHEAFETSAGDGAIAIGLLSGPAVFFAADVMIDRLGRAEQTTPAGVDTAAAGRAIVLGIISTGFPSPSSSASPCSRPERSASLFWSLSSSRTSRRPSPRPRRSSGRAGIRAG
jgi:hypothetical protein